MSRIGRCVFVVFVVFVVFFFVFSSLIPGLSGKSADIANYILVNLG